MLRALAPKVGGGRYLLIRGDERKHTMERGNLKSNEKKKGSNRSGGMWKKGICDKWKCYYRETLRGKMTKEYQSEEKRGGGQKAEPSTRPYGRGRAAKGNRAIRRSTDPQSVRREEKRKTSQR